MTTKERMMELLVEVCRYLHFDVPKLVLADTKRGMARRVRTINGVEDSITMPTAILDYNEAFVKYYIVHEVMHLASNNAKHDLVFKTRESEALCDLYAIGIKYARAYPKYLFEKENPKVILWGESDKHLGVGLCLTMKEEKIEII